MTLDQHVEVAIRCALAMNPPDEYRVWAEKWLSGEDRTDDPAWEAAWVARHMGAKTAMDAARSAAWLASSHIRRSERCLPYCQDAIDIARDHGIDVDAIIESVKGKP